MYPKLISGLALVLALAAGNGALPLSMAAPQRAVWLLYGTSHTTRV